MNLMRYDGVDLEGSLTCYWIEPDLRAPRVHRGGGGSA